MSGELKSWQSLANSARVPALKKNVPTSYKIYWGSRYYASDSVLFNKAEDISHP